MKPLITIAINNYNYESFVAAAIDSALGQSWDDTEVLVIDDGSTDDSKRVIEAYGDRIGTIYRANGGQAGALNEVFAKSSGDVVIFLDADDTLHPDTASRVAAAFSTSPTLSRVQWPMQTTDRFGHPCGPVVPTPKMMRSGDLRDHLLGYRTYVWSTTSGNAYSRTVLERVMPVPAEYSFGADQYLANTTVLFGPICSLSTVGGTYRVHGDNNWSHGRFDMASLHQRIEWTVLTHRYVKDLCDELGVQCSPDSREALDVAFVSARLASLRLDPEAHPMQGDTRLRLALKGTYAAIRHPHHSRLHKTKRVVWLIALAVAPQRWVRPIVERFYFRPT